jgi:hypothetical protein
MVWNVCIGVLAGPLHVELGTELVARGSTGPVVRV